MLEKLPTILKFTLNSLNSVALLTTNKRESDQHSLSFFVPHSHYRVTKDLIERSFITVYSAPRLKDKAYLKHYKRRLHEIFHLLPHFLFICFITCLEWRSYETVRSNRN